MEIFDCLNPDTDADADNLSEGISAAVSAIMNNQLVIFPTDTGYALVGNAFSDTATGKIRSVKGMSAADPLQVLLRDAEVLDGVAPQASLEARSLADAFWPGPLSMIVQASRTVQWDVTSDRRYVQVRVPDHPVALEVLKLTGPLAASAARGTGMPMVESVDDVESLKDDVAVFLDCGPLRSETLSTVLDCSSETETVAILRKGPVTAGQIVDVLNYMPRILDPN